MMCALCENELEPKSRSVLCLECRAANEKRIRRMGAFDSAFGSMNRALANIVELVKLYPEAAPLVESARLGIANDLDLLAGIRAELHGVDDAIDRKMMAAHLAR